MRPSDSDAATPVSDAPTRYEDICPRCLAVSLVDGDLPAGQFCARCAALPSAALLDLDALERLAREAQKPVAAWRQPDDDDDGVQWDRWRSAQGEFGATVHSPEFILAL